MSKEYSFTSYIKSTKTFNLILENFSLALSWYMRVKVSAIRLTISATSFLLNIPVVFKVKKIKFTISIIKLLQNLPLMLKVKKIKFTAISRAMEKWMHIVAVKKIKISAIIRLLGKLPSVTIKVKKIKIVANPQVGIFKTLYYYDDYYLSDMDDSYLSDLEYSAS